jgi:ribose transport system ATP-binding protein
MTTEVTLLQISGLSKSFSASVRALSNVDFDLRAGEIHALVGENGAGKSTLSRIIAGLEKPDTGEMRLRGRRYSPESRADADRNGVRMVMQELNLIGTLTIAESIYIDRMPHRYGVIDYRRLNRQARELMDSIGLVALAPSRRVQDLGVGQQQMVEIAAGISRRCEILILDEPTAALTEIEIDQLFQQIEKLKASGAGIIYISHRMGEIRRIADRITILRDGRVIATHPACEVTLEVIIREMVGRDLNSVPPPLSRKRGDLALSVRGLSSGERVKDVSFDLYRGEILGFAGLMGSGRTETMRAIFGADRADGGQVHLGDSEIPLRIRGPRDAVRAGIAFLTENRKEQGLLLSLPVRANITLARLKDMVRFGLLKSRQERTAAERLAKNLGVRASSIEQRTIELSGGNQQKVVIAKWIFRDSEIFIFDEPTRGIDIGAKFEIYELLRELAEKGKAIIVVSSELEELIGICDRIAVMSAGRLAAIVERDRFDQDSIMAIALSGHIGNGRKADGRDGRES